MNLEAELQTLVESADYDVRIVGMVFPTVVVCYRNRPIASNSFVFDIWRWWRIRRFVLKTVKGHRKLASSGVRLS